MIPFTDLLRTGLSPDVEQKQAETQLPLLVARSHLHLWQPGDVAVTPGMRLLVGVATYSMYDLRLLEVVDETLQRPRDQPLRVEVFNTLDGKTHEDFAQYIPGIGPVFQTPVVGIWENGYLRDRAWGAAARSLVAQTCGFNVADVVQWTAALGGSPR